MLNLPGAFFNVEIKGFRDEEVRIQKKKKIEKGKGKVDVRAPECEDEMLS